LEQSIVAKQNYISPRRVPRSSIFGAVHTVGGDRPNQWRASKGYLSESTSPWIVGPTRQGMLYAIAIPMHEIIIMGKLT
jgi:hypothetical protein